MLLIAIETIYLVMKESRSSNKQKLCRKSTKFNNSDIRVQAKNKFAEIFLR